MTVDVAVTTGEPVNEFHFKPVSSSTFSRADVMFLFACLTQKSINVCEL